MACITSRISFIQTPRQFNPTEELTAGKKRLGIRVEQTREREREVRQNPGLRPRAGADYARLARPAFAATVSPMNIQSGVSVQPYNISFVSADIRPAPVNASICTPTRQRAKNYGKLGKFRRIGRRPKEATARYKVTQSETERGNASRG